MFGKKKEMSPSEQKAKLAALKGAKDMAEEEMKKGLGGLKKVSVSSPSKEGLKKGLEMAEEFLGEKEEEDSEMSDSMEDAQEGFEDQQEESMPMSEEEIDAEIQKLMELKAKLSEE